MGRDELQELSCTLIACAGDAYGHFNTAINLASEGNFDAANDELKAGRASIAEGHKSQLALLQDEATGNACPIGILEVHAQDHLMNAMSFENTARQIIALYRRVESLEKGDR
jgi:PTS system cellobiose-specific IIA component